MTAYAALPFEANLCRIPDELIVEGFRGELAAQLVGLLDLGQHLDDIHHTHCQLLGDKQLICEVLLQGQHHPLLKQGPRVLCPPFHQTLQPQCQCRRLDH